MQLKVDLTGIKELQKKLKDLSNLSENDLLENVAYPVMEATEKSFERETDPWGKAWVNKDSKTFHHLDSMQNPNPKARAESGDMKGSLHSTVNKGSVYIGFPNVSQGGFAYPMVHQFGTKDGKIPARPFMPVDINGNLEPRVQADIMQSVGDLIEYNLKK